jgi:hypothetical protein
MRLSGQRHNADVSHGKLHSELAAQQEGRGNRGSDETQAAWHPEESALAEEGGAANWTPQ